MLNKTKKVAFLTSGLAGALVVSSAVGVALSSCTTTTSSSDTSNNKYTYSIDWTDQDQLNHLTIDEQGLVYSSASKTEIIAVAPNTATTSFVIPASVKYITGYNEITKNSDGTVATSTTKGAFQNLVSLISVTFASNNTLVSIGDSSFSGCTYLSTINLPSSTSVVYNNAFYGCANLRSINLSGVSYIGSAAFQGAMANGAGVSLDLSAASYIGDNAFNGSSSLVSADFSKNTTLSYIGKSAFANAFVSGEKTVTLDLSKTENLRTISDNAFLNCTKLGSVVLPSNSVLSTIGANAFSGATSLTQVGSTANAFTASSSLGNYATTTVNSTSYVSSGIGANAFNGTKIASVDLSAVTSATTPFTASTFKGMTSLASVNFGSSSKITTIPYSLFEGDTALASLTLPASITSIANGASSTENTRSPFYGCTGLKTVDMSAITSYAASAGSDKWYTVSMDNTTMLPASLFQNLTALTTVALKKGTVVIGANAFNGASALTTVKEGSISTAADTTEGLVIPSTLQMINTAAFQGTGIKSVTFASTGEGANNSLWFVGKDAFKNATALTSVDLSTAKTTGTYNIAPGAFYDSGSASVATEITGFAGVSSGTFSGASALETIKLPSSITNIYSGAFVNNTALTSVNFDKLTALTSIQTNNFTGASKLATIDLSATAMAASAFAVASIFTGLPTAATLTLPSVATNLDDTSFLIGEATAPTPSTRPAVTYSGTTGLNLLLDKSSNKTIAGVTGQTVGAIGSGSSTSIGNYPNKMLQYISGNYDLTKSVNTSANTSSGITSGKDIAYYYPWTFFGNDKLTGLTMSASKFVLGGTAAAPTQATELFIINSSGSIADYTYKTVPFGQNTALKNFVFTNFDVNESPTYPVVSSQTANNPLYKTSAKTWAQVATIINKFASNSTTANALWTSPTAGNQDTTSKINSDSAISGGQGKVTTGTDANNTKYVLELTEVHTPNTANDAQESNTPQKFTFSAENVISTADKVDTAIFFHNGVKWTLSVYSPTHATNPGAITLVGENINVYKGSINTKYNQIPFATTTTDGTTTANKITVTLNIVPSTKTTA